MSHRKTIQHFRQPAHLHEFTFSTYRRLPLLTNDEWGERLGRTLEAAGAERCFQLVAFVFMPEHLQLLTYPNDEKLAFGKYLARIKQPFSRQIKYRRPEQAAHEATFKPDFPAARFRQNRVVPPRNAGTARRCAIENGTPFGRLFRPTGLKALVAAR